MPLLVTLSVFLLGSVTHAAPGPALGSLGGPTAITAGVFVPSGGDAKRRGGDGQLAVEFRYTLPVSNPFVVPTRTVLGLGLQTGARGGGHSSVIPVTVTELFGADGKSPNSVNAFYGGLGAGLYVLNQSGLSSAVRLGLCPEIGYNVTNTAFVDAKYQFVAHAAGFSAMAGVRF